MRVSAPHAQLHRAARGALDRRNERRIPEHLTSRWRGEPVGARDEWLARRTRFRQNVIPWLDRTRPLDGASILEIGAGQGASTAALAEQGAHVHAIDLDEPALKIAADHLEDLQLAAEFEVANAQDITDACKSADWVIYWAVLEHMTIDERLESLASAWAGLRQGALLTVVETPNRLWPHDSHTSQLPFASWLPYELGYRYSRFSPRATFGGEYNDSACEAMEPFLRRGWGVSYHEFELAIGRGDVLRPVSCMQVDRRHQDPLRRVAWQGSLAGRTASMLRRYDRSIDEAWFQPFLYLTLTRP